MQETLTAAAFVEAAEAHNQAVAHEAAFGLGVTAAKLLASEFGSAEPLVGYMLDQEVAKSELRGSKLELEGEIELHARKNLSLALENERLIEVSNKDPLTGLANRRGAEAAYQRLVSHTKTENDRRHLLDIEQAEAQILVFDVDDFKYTNDTYGHDAGDELLTRIAGIMTANTRQNHVMPDVIARLGGDEFLILMYGAPRHIADSTASAIREEVKDLVTTDERLKSSVSIGIGAVDISLSLRQIVDKADQALLQAKRDGKNVVVHFDDLSESA